ncbi:hypothetical protein [Pseudomonas aeruginosa]|uniref:hypothetical protein n=1 Tax=Pseudomonas aeruginosa TaxID=287 RepID=UPI003D9C17EA
MEDRGRHSAALADQERVAADWAWATTKPAGLGTGTLPGRRWWWWPLSAEEGHWRCSVSRRWTASR